MSYTSLSDSHLLQGAFVLCRLFKKQDETLEGLTCDNAELVVASPTARSSPDDTESELAIAQDGPSFATQVEPPDEDCEQHQYVPLENDKVRMQLITSYGLAVTHF